MKVTKLYRTLFNLIFTVSISLTYFLLSQVLIKNIQAAGADNYDVVPRVFVDQNNDGLYTVGIDTPISGEAVRWSREPKSATPVYNLITDADGLAQPLSNLVGISENDPSRVYHATIGGATQRIKTFGIRPQEGGNQDILGETINFQGKDQIVTVHFMPQVPPGTLTVNTPTSGCVLSSQPYVDISWTFSQYVTPNGGGNNNTYYIYRSPTGLAGSFVNIGQKNDGTSTYRDSGSLTPNTTYYYYVIAQNGWNQRVSTNTPSLTTTCTTSLNVAQSGTLSSPAPAGVSFGQSGNQSTQGGINYFNPMNIALQTTTSNPVVTEYYVAFYDKGNPVNPAYSNGSTFMSDVKGYLSTDTKRGFLIAFGKAVTGCPAPPSTSASAYLPCMNADTHYVWDILNNRWQNIDVVPYNTLGYTICGFTNCTGQTPYYLVFGNGFSGWKLSFDQAFTSKDMHTAVFLRDSSAASNLISNITPTP